MEESSDILFEEESFNGIRIKAASVDKLLEECLKNFGKLKFQYCSMHWFLNYFHFNFKLILKLNNSFSFLCIQLLFWLLCKNNIFFP